jgi:hypothetical protein
MKVNLSNAWLKAGAVVGTFMATSPVFAQATISTITSNVNTTTHTLGQTLTDVCYGIGSLGTVKTIHGLYMHGKDQQNKIQPALVTGAASAGFLCGPQIISVLTAATIGSSGGSSAVQSMGQSSLF